MKIINYLIITFVTCVLASSVILSISRSSLAFATDTDDWPMFHHDLTHTGYSTNTPTATSPTLLWNFTTNMVIWASPAVVDGKVYVGSDGGVAYCLNASDGTAIWNYTLPVRNQGRPGASGPAIGSSMAVSDGYVYFGSYDRNVYCLNANTGEKVWNYTTRNTVQSSPAVVNGKVYVGLGTATFIALTP